MAHPRGRTPADQRQMHILNCWGGIHTIVGKWDLLIAHPPCTFLTTAGAIRLFNQGGIIKDYLRLQKGKDAAEFFMAFLNADCDRIAVENPIPMKIFGLPQYTQIIEPYEYGHPFKKKTCLWLKNLPKLIPTDIVEPTGYWIGAHGHDKAKYGMSKGFRDPKMRSKTFPGIAKAMAEQWSKETPVQWQISIFEGA